MSGAAGNSLLPASLVGRLASAPTPKDAVRIGGAEAYRYNDLALKNGGNLTAFAVPSSKGVVNLFCAEAEGGGQSDGCESIAASLVLLSGESYGLGSDADYQQKVDAAIAKLNVSVSADRKALKTTNTPSGQAAKARELADAYRSAAAGMATASPVLQSAASKLRASLSNCEIAYQALASAAAKGSSSGFNRAKRRIASCESALKKLS